MKHFMLIWSALGRKRVRTVLTSLSIIVAFFLFGILDGITAAFDQAIDRYSDESRLRTQSSVGIFTWLPLAHLATIERVPGVSGVAYNVPFGGYFQEPANSISSYAVDPDRIDAMYPKVILSQAQRDAFGRMRTGAVIGVDLASEYGWRIGDRVPLRSTLWSRRGGSNDWAFDVVGIYRFPDDAFPANSELWINYRYFDQAREFANGTVQVFFVNVDDPARAAEVAGAIDRRFANSPAETKTQTEKDFILGQIDQIGNISVIVHAVIGAVMFALLFVTANTMMQSVRERTAEFAVLRAYGFTIARIGALVVIEAAVLCVFASLFGLVTAALVFPSVFRSLGIAAIPVEPSVMLTGVAIALLVAIASALPPVLRARKLQVVDGLARK